MWELKNKKTGKLYWLNDVEYDLDGRAYDPIQRLKDQGLYTKFTILEIRSPITIKDPLKIEITKTQKVESRRGKNLK